MPIKGLKFARRRSSSNILDLADRSASPDAPSSQRSSFRVIPRADSDSHGYESSGNFSLKRQSAVKSSSAGRPSSQPLYYRASTYDDGSDNSNRGSSGNTYGSTSAKSRSDHRDSYASTEPSSLESRSQEDLHTKPGYAAIPHTSRPLPTLPPPPPPPAPQMEAPEPEPEASWTKQEPDRDRSFSFKAAARTFSFGTRNKGGGPSNSRDRSATESSYASTATPPKLDLGNDLGLGEGGFGNDFSDLLGKRKSTIMEDPQAEESLSTEASDHTLLGKGVSRGYSLGPRPSLEDSSEERRLIASPPPDRAFQHTSPPLPGASGSNFALDAINASSYLDRTYSQPFRQDAPSTTSYALRSRGDGPPASRPQGRMLQQATIGGLNHKKNFVDGSLLEGGDASGNLGGGGGDDDEPLFDTLRAPRVSQFRPRRPLAAQKPATTKVMTPAEFESYRSKMQETSTDDDTRSENSDSSVNYEDEDETDRNRQAAKQRRRQEAQLAVYRQQMVKVTGEQPSELPTKLGKAGGGGGGRPSLSLGAGGRISNFMGQPSALESAINDDDDADEDDDVPLGILQAHGFPTKHKAPRRMSSSSFAAPAEQRTYPAPPGATRNDASTGGGGSTSLPPFARNLPADPYVGASLVSQPTRENLRSSYNLAGGAQGPHGGLLPPGGLVGVIAGEERARALRRGSPNTQGVYEHPQAMPQATGHMGFGAQVPMMPLQPGMGAAGDQTQMEFNASMAQMMQMQMQWMQQMMAAYGGNANGQVPGNMPVPMSMPMSSGMMPMPTGAMPGVPSMRRFPTGDGRAGSIMQQPLQPAYAGFSHGGPYQQPNHSSPSLLHPSSASTFSLGLQRQRHQQQQQQQQQQQYQHRPQSSLSSYGPNGRPGGEQAYAPSIAPSERSNVGQPSRYRPVSVVGEAVPPPVRPSSAMAGAAGRSRSQSQLTVTASRPGTSLGLSSATTTTRTTTMMSGGPGRASMAAPSATEHLVQQGQQQKRTVRAVDRPKHGGGSGGGGGGGGGGGTAGSDEEDEGWAEVSRKRAERKSRWKLRGLSGAASAANSPTRGAIRSDSQPASGRSGQQEQADVDFDVPEGALYCG